jgi:hypothetical protein
MEEAFICTCIYILSGEEEETSKKVRLGSAHFPQHQKKASQPKNGECRIYLTTSDDHRPSHHHITIMGGKRDDIEPFRPEIEQRTAAGENCEQIAAALKAQGCDVSSKTVSRYRVSWGIRQRAEPKTKGRKCKL